MDVDRANEHSIPFNGRFALVYQDGTFRIVLGNQNDGVVEYHVPRRISRIIREMPLSERKTVIEMIASEIKLIQDTFSQAQAPHELYGLLLAFRTLSANFGLVAKTILPAERKK